MKRDDKSFIRIERVSSPQNYFTLFQNMNVLETIMKLALT